MIIIENIKNSRFFKNEVLKKILNPNDNSIYSVTKYFFNYLEWLIILATIEFIWFKTEDFFIFILFLLSFFLFSICMGKMIYDHLIFSFLKKIYKNKQIKKIVKKFVLKPKEEVKMRGILISLILSFIIGSLSALAILNLITKMLITVG